MEAIMTPAHSSTAANSHASRFVSVLVSMVQPLKGIESKSVLIKAVQALLQEQFPTITEAEAMVVAVKVYAEA